MAHFGLVRGAQQAAAIPNSLPIRISLVRLRKLVAIQKRNQAAAIVQKRLELQLDSHTAQPQPHASTPTSRNSNSSRHSHSLRPRATRRAQANAAASPKLATRTLLCFDRVFLCCRRCLRNFRHKLAGAHQRETENVLSSGLLQASREEPHCSRLASYPNSLNPSS